MSHDHAPLLAFVFAGQGAQWFGMGRQLLRTEPAFDAAMRECDQAMRRHVDFSVLEQLMLDEPESRLREIDVLQPTMVSLQIALAALWRDWGVRPDAVVGHSMGEIAAAHVAGALSLADAATIACRRSALLRRISGEGALAVTELSESEAGELAAAGGGRVSVAGCNSPSSTVLAGDLAALEDIVRTLEERDVFCKVIRNTVASHSHYVDKLRDDLHEALAGLRPGRAEVAMYSTATLDLLSGPELTASYWMRNLRRPVQFARAVGVLAERGHGTFLEISPHPVLLTAVRQCLTHDGRTGETLASGRRDGERESLAQSRARLIELGHARPAPRPRAEPRLTPYQAALYDAVFARR
ncbi:acyltransferase domain-containing protein [Amycolatopsis cihanbeyliensis]|uniref:Acyl transferase family protein n=1 Tax=Amycolatopsis cihanbeyliensis TaxID=1128664 RepID=A0A542DJE8_AMYCI|nr:acyltransferase domain-containing protein [Amycolatopsis cihanbeyliensis]TQJ03200.1 acyl transferase family protein [Amycolatopsis cihanbeyliensis]WCB87239.1 EfrCII [Amycolatopsis cihanbeyliensis]